jgi:hypothetical protein
MLPVKPNALSRVANLWESEPGARPFKKANEFLPNFYEPLCKKLVRIETDKKGVALPWRGAGMAG